MFDEVAYLDDPNISDHDKELQWALYHEMADLAETKLDFYYFR